jgi:AcrR family transcriptional regulator
VQSIGRDAPLLHRQQAPYAEHFGLATGLLRYPGNVRVAGEATRERILVAAKKEFADRGLAGARINRIATEANASKERLYAYFPSKESLFAAVTEQLVADVSADTELRGDDIPGYVGRLFDNYVRNPENARLHDWLGFGTTETNGAEVVELKAKLDEISRGQQAGHIDTSWDPAQLLIMLTEITKSLACPKGTALKLLNTNRRNNTRAARRAAAINAARRLSTRSNPASPTRQTSGRASVNERATRGRIS